MDGWRHFLAVVIFLLHCIDCKDYCHNEEFLADCRPHLSDKTHRLVLIDRALYGRMSLGPCVKTDFGFVGCYNDVTPYVHSRCSGRTSCTVRVPDPLLDLTNPCNEDLKSYLQANFSCVEISQPSQDGLCKAVIPVGNTPLYFARISSNFGVTGSNLGDGRSDCGLPTKPWVVTAQVGQKLNITLLDFSKASNDFTLSSHPLASLSSSSSSSSSSFARQRNVIKRQPSYHVKRSVNIRHESQRKSVKGDDDDDDSHHHIQRRHRPQNLNDPRLTPNDLNLSPSLRDLTCDQYAMVEELLGSMLHPSPLKPKTPSSSSSSSSSSSPSSSSSSSSNPTIKHYLCGNGTQPWTRSYVSQTHQVRLSMLLPYLENHYYIIKIQAVGCPDSLPTPSNSWMRRESENEMVVGCLDEFQHTWTLTCIGNRWEGEPWNCSAAGKKGSVPPELGPFSIGAAVFVVVGVSLFIGLLVLFIGLYYIKRRRAASSGGQLNMRDLRPLNCESFSPNVIANNQQQQLHNNKPSSTTSTVTTTSGKSRGKNNKDYECVWEVPSGKSLTLLARDSSPNKKFNQYLNENRVSSTVNKLDSFKQKNLIVKAPFKDDLRQKVFFGNSQISGKTSGTCTCCCQEKFNTDSNHLRRIAPAVTSVGHVTIGHAPRVDDVTTTVTGHRKPPSCLTFPKQSSVAMGAARQNQLNDRCFKSSDLLEDEEEVPASRVCQHCGHSATTTACDGAPISESTPSIFVDSTAPAPVLPYRLVPPGSETLTRKPFLPSLALDAAEIFKRSQDSGMPSSLGSIGRDPLTSQQRHQQRLSQRHSVPRETTNNNDNNMSTESAETPPILHPRKRRT